MRIAVIGGRLQGLEAAYLAKKAGWEVLLVDKCNAVPALNLADYFIQIDASRKEELAVAFEGVDLVIPALENRQVLGNLVEIAKSHDIPVAFDLKTYDVSVSKKISDRFFVEIGIPAPQPWPNCNFPLIAKPDRSSGSENVVRLQDERELHLFLNEVGQDLNRWVIQEYLEGPFYSIEIIGYNGQYLPLQVTDLEMDEIYDCKRVIAPSGLSTNLRERFVEIALQIARKLKLNGIMDVEVIHHNNELKVLEIDARLPSQTPTVVYQSTGINLLELVADCFLYGYLNSGLHISEEKAVIYEHIVVSPGKLAFAGEHAVSLAGPLNYHENFFGADEALTNYMPGKKNWTATLIIKGKNRNDVRDKREAVISRVKKTMDIDCCYDPLTEAHEITAIKEKL